MLVLGISFHFCLLILFKLHNCSIIAVVLQICFILIRSDFCIASLTCLLTGSYVFLFFLARVLRYELSDYENCN